VETGVLADVYRPTRISIALGVLPQLEMEKAFVR